MGTINFKTSDIITLAIKPYNFDTTKTSILCNLDEYDGMTADDVTDDVIYEEIQGSYDADTDNAKYIINQYSFDCYSIDVVSGYYDSIQILINFEYDCFDDYTEKRQAQKEITQLKKCLLDLAGVGFVACFPSWCTSYCDYHGTIKAINEAIKDERRRIANVPTWATFSKRWKQKTACNGTF